MSQPISSDTGVPHGGPPPKQYEAVAMCGTITTLCGWIMAAAGALMVIVAIGFNGIKDKTPLIVGGIGIVFSGIFQIGFGSMLHMLRDTALHIMRKL